MANDTSIGGPDDGARTTPVIRIAPHPGSPVAPSYEEHLAGRLLDKGADVNLRAHMLDLAAKWDAIAGDGRDKRSTTLGGCARDLRELAGRPS